ncbi:hypothetical protein O7606_13375 [Micromonospora sp. WMMD882]|uniref:hypothetical protein n=1 Tax=Micromonospora sp. WMMD882 TaxID=3015151 RepID=UPI00248AF8AC|nr:hypothetical protein [Micromonospora sp. WMMD882]WBB77291.1 hypothetical protein O7606_13375 [Micromonospora sp. WMMD882]
MWEGDPRERADGIGWVTRAVFPDPRLRLSVGRGDSGPAGADGARVRYAVVPSVDRARFLLPLASRRVGAASTWAYNALRPSRVRLNRLAVGLLAGVGATRAAGMPVLTVAVPAEVDRAEVLLVDHLAAVLGDRLHAAIGIRPPDPHHKPTLQLFDDRGRPRGYAKIGWNDATRAMVRAEADALRNLARGGADLPDAPRLLGETEWGELAVTVVEPMPSGVRGLRRPAEPQLAAMLAVARRGGPPTPARPLRGSPFLADLSARAERADLSARAERADLSARTERADLSARAEQADLSARAEQGDLSAGGARSGPADGAQWPGGTFRDVVVALAERYGEVSLEFGDWHGDWVPWNLGDHRGRLIAWDWENSGSDRPVGFDLAHQGFQSALSLGGRPAAEAAEQMVALLDRHGAALGLDADRRRLVGDAYLVELWLRTAELAAGGGGWSPKLYPALPKVLAERLR